jgi:hypothetical protein
VFFNGILEAPAAIFRFAFDDAGYYRRRYANQFCRRDDWMIE